MRFNFKERLGVLEAGIIFTKEILWVYRDQPLVDVGIDALIEESENGNPTGKFLAAQIKSGKGNFFESGDKLVHYVSNVHHHYWLNLDLPIIIIAHLPVEDITCWEFINGETLVKTEKQWKIEIPKDKILCRESKTELQQIIKSNIQSDFLSQFLEGNIDDDELKKIVESTKKIESLTTTLFGVTDVLNNLSEGLVRNTHRIKHYVAKKLGKSSRQVKKVVSDTSSLMNRSAQKMDELMNDFSSDFAEAFGAYEKIAVVEFHLTKDYAGLEEAYIAMDELVKTIRSSTGSMITMRNEVSALPREFPNLEGARLRMIDSCNAIINEFKISNKMANRFCQWMYERLY